MPLATLHLLQLHTSASALLNALRSDSSIEIILASIPQFHVIRPQTLDIDTLNQKWDLLLLLKPASPGTKSNTLLSSTYTSHIKAHYILPVGIPSRLLSTYPERNKSLLSASAGHNSRIKFSFSSPNDQNTQSSSQNLELSPELLAFGRDFTQRYGKDQAVTMLNLLHFVPEGGKKAYAQYGRAFVDVAGKRGGDAKIVGNVIAAAPAAGTGTAGNGGVGESSAGSRKESEWWNEISLVHYPSIAAFCDMLAGEDYQEINRRYRLGALRDTLLICTREVDGDGEKAEKARL